MSAIQTLRNKSGLITIVIGVALLAFIVTGLDPKMFTAKGQDNIIAEINGEEFPSQAYYEIYEEISRNQNPNASEMQKQGAYSQAWDRFVNKYVYLKQYNTLGLGVYNQWLNLVGVSQSEIKDAITGDNIEPSLKQAFTDPQTGQFNKEQLLGTVQNLGKLKEQNPEGYKSWINFEKNLHESKLQEKYSNLVAKAFYPTSLEIEMAINSKKESFDIDYVKIDYTQIPDTSIVITDDEIKARYEEKKDSPEYEVEANVTFDYVTFDVVPTQEDILNTEKYVAEKALAFKKSHKESSFLRVNSDIQFNPTYYKKGQLASEIDTFAFSQGIDSITNIYKENNTYKIAKISDIRYEADSAKVRHILLNKATAQKEADSIKALLEDGADFAELALKHSADSASAIVGGVTDWFKAGQWPPQFQDTSFVGEKGKIYLCPTRYGIHIIEILEQGPKTKRVQVQYLAKEVVYSEVTRSSVYKEAVTFASNNDTKEKFDEAIEKNGLLIKHVAENILENQRYIAGIDDSRQIIKWAHQNKEEGLNKISEIFTCKDKFVIAVLTDVNEKGPKSLKSAEADIKAELLKEKQKQAILDKLSKLDANASLAQIGTEFNVLPQKAQGIMYAMTSAPGIQEEPKVIGTASKLEAGKRSEAIEGKDGIFYIVVTGKKPNEAVNADNEKASLKRSKSQQAMGRSFQYLKEKANIVDNRIYFQ